MSFSFYDGWQVAVQLLLCGVLPPGLVHYCLQQSCVVAINPSWKLSKLDKPDTRDTAGEVGTSSKMTYSWGPPHMDEQRQDNQLEPIYSSSVQIWDVALKTCRKQWMIEKGGGRGSGISMLMVRHHDDDED